jgi:hypothetical protein
MVRSAGVRWRAADRATAASGCIVQWARPGFIS